MNKINSFKNTFFTSAKLLLLVLAISIASTSFAGRGYNEHRSFYGGSFYKIIFDELDLSRDQKNEIRDIMNESRMNRDNPIHEAMMTNISSYLEKITVTYDDYYGLVDMFNRNMTFSSSKHLNNISQVYDVLTASQKNQLIEMIDDKEFNYEDRIRGRKRNRDKDVNNSVERLTRKLDLTTQQTAFLEDITNKIEGFEDKKEYFENMNESLKDALSADGFDRVKLEGIVQDNTKKVIDNIKSLAPEVTAFVNSLDKEQKEDLQDRFGRFGRFGR